MKDKGIITFINREDSPEVREKLNPDSTIKELKESSEKKDEEICELKKIIKVLLTHIPEEKISDNLVEKMKNIFK